MTYGGFLLLFLVVPLVLSVGACRSGLRRGGWRSIALVLPIVYGVTPLWDHAAVARGFWSFAPDRVWGIHVGLVPLEEVLFFGLQTLLAGCWVRRGIVRG
jgi:lycopene cyclase domain-containing protein